MPVARHGSVARAKLGCTCLPCRQAKAEDQGDVIPIAKSHKASRQVKRAPIKKTTEENSSVENPSPPVHVIGPNEAAVIAEVRDLELAKTRPAMVMMARSMAATLDNPKQAAQWAQCVRQLTQILETLAGNNAGAKGVPRRKSGGRLATVANMTKSRRAQ